MFRSVQALPLYGTAYSTLKGKSSETALKETAKQAFSLFSCLIWEPEYFTNRSPSPMFIITPHSLMIAGRTPAPDWSPLGLKYQALTPTSGPDPGDSAPRWTGSTPRRWWWPATRPDTRRSTRTVTIITIITSTGTERVESVTPAITNTEE